MKVGIIGAGVAGLTTAKTLRQAGHDVVVWDRTPDVGGVWSATRRYPGLCTQSPRDTYALSDFPMPRSMPEWPSGEQVQSYLASYADHFGLDEVLRLRTEVVSADPDGEGWRVVTRPVDGGATTTTTVDHLVVANGVFCEPLVPQYDGIDDFTAAGGKVVAANDLHDAEDARGKHVVVVGYGKSACDLAVAVAETADSTDVIARQLLWKVPRKVGGKVNFKFLLLTRMGEALFRYRYIRGAEKFLHGVGNPIRKNMLSSVGDTATKQFHLEKLGLLPRGQFSDIVRGAIGLATEGFFEAVEDGTITVHRDTVVRRVLEKDGRPHAELADGTVLPADLIVCATGFLQGVPFLPAEVQERLFDERGNFRLYRQVLPARVPRLSFSGYNSSFFSPLSAEMGAVWLTALLGGGLQLPDAEAMDADITGQLEFLDDALDRHHCRGTKVIPFSLHNIDELLRDVDAQIGSLTRANHWLAPVAPKAYRKVTAKVVSRLG